MTNTNQAPAQSDHRPQPRYALYFAPIANALWWSAGSHWLGRDAATNASLPQENIVEISPTALHQLTTDARRYGFHATLKAPFRLAEGFSESDLIAMAQAFSGLQNSLEVKAVSIQPLGQFLALQTTDQPTKDRISALATRCVRYFDLLRAAPSAAELSKRRKTALTSRQEILLAEWGYPYTEEEYRFHLTLTDALTKLDADTVDVIRHAAEVCFSQALTTPLIIDGLTIFKERAPGEPMTILRHFPFLNRPDLQSDHTSPLPYSGRLFFVVGPSGVGKDALLQWVQTQLSDDTGLVFATRCITRAAHASESHEVLTQEEFLQYSQAGHFSMAWQAHDTHYGIRREIEATLKSGCNVVVNGSREFIPQLRQLFPQAEIIWISADAELIRQRIESRQRENGTALEQRLLRSEEFNPQEIEGITHIDNSGAIEVAGRQLLNIFQPGDLSL
ncbi:phosphonate metabolism protein/1,5-bisphosphokinase (PRPP-forming) PhnN [Glaciimonas sp. PCH181]|uniref:phosphonate metabolism protein/1,5-bisphosphokinase (PRPP-forming) PhnN n=1 Tax=Glaciimonas sp. PCH181 TaxID=2133943 RepID=UPI000D3764F1|nr:phosphonate metabolism protein/1,5-bisphosphokinase (PRPP-forming) PhnN [Glaciimonas sp. PCH181]PUA18146.1 phosphonate metabolism protein/1,5-bisphosphokinase (PRPP-forming) PhnN [Glaciimonas sp. PCH181]